MTQDRIRLTQVSADDQGRLVVREQPSALLGHHRVAIDVNDAGPGYHRLDHFVGVADRRQPGADVQELPHALLGNPLRGPLMKAAVRPGAVPDLRHHAQNLPGRLDVGREVVAAAQHVVVYTGRGWLADIHPGGRIRDPGHRSLHPFDLTVLSVAHDSHIANGPLVLTECLLSRYDRIMNMSCFGERVDGLVEMATLLARR